MRRALRDRAVAFGAKVRTSAKVVEVRPDETRPSVVLESGEVLEADVLVGADGITGITRKCLLGDDEPEEEKVVRILYKCGAFLCRWYGGANFSVCSALLNEEDVIADPETAHLIDPKQVGGRLTAWRALRRGSFL